ncbi:MFS transporter [Enterococcus mundtii]|nr:MULTISPECIES: MFS transporter [Enterococcus]AZP92514.1 MFS transporter [Enterococcus mundtii]EYT94749.1 MFS transporter [Enterococcus mundtii CRL35]MDA9429591.1 major facilitator superfamily MFS_1 [Enterococcus mundtii 1A]MDK4211550.1 MFS transporter [Enterococcus mundtii]MDO7879845.1 MFS transporter [Enterococcus mundtii]
MSKTIYDEKNWKTNIAYLLTSQAISMIGTMLVQYAIIWHVTLSTQSGTMVGLMNVIGILPMVLVMPFAGALSDHYDRKKIAILSDSCVALASLVMAILLIMDKEMAHNLFLLLGLIFIRSVGQGFQTPAVSSLIPQITTEKHLVRVNGIDQAIQAVIMLASPALAATLLTVLPLEMILMIDFVTAVIGVTMLFFRVTVPQMKSQETNKINVLSEINSGVKYLRIHKILLALILVGFMGSIFSTPAANLAPLQITRNFHEGLWQLSATEIGFASGMLVGGSVMSTWGGFKNKIKTIALGYSLLILPFIMLGITSSFWLYFAMMVAIGFVVPISRTAMVSFFQAKTDQSHMGRVMSLVTMAISIASPATMLILGPLTDVISIDWIMIASGLILIPLVLWLLVGKSFRF